MEKNYISYFKLNSVFTRMFIILLISSIIPILAGNAVIFKQSSATIEEQACDASLNVLNKTMEMVDLVFRQSDQIIPQIAKDASVVNFIINPDSESISKYSKIIGSLRNIKTSNNYILSIYIYSAHSKTVLSSDGGMYKIDEFYDKNWLNEYRDCYFETKFLNTRKITDAIGNSFNCITLIRNLPYSSMDKLGAVVININEDKLYNTISGIDSKGQTYVVDGNGLILSHSDKSKLFTSINKLPYARKILSGRQGFFVEKENGVSVLYTYISSFYNDWRYVYTIPLSNLKTNFQTISTMILITTLLCILLCFCLSFFFTRGMYNPVHKLMELVAASNKLLAYSKELPAKNEYEFIGYFYNDVINKNKDMEVIIENSKPTIKDKLFTNLITGNINDLKEINEKLNFLNICYNSSNFIVIAIQIDDYNEFDSKYSEVEKNLYKIQLIKKVEESLNEKQKVICLEMEKDKIAVIINFDKSLTVLQINEATLCMASQIKREIEECLPFTVTLGIGRGCEDIRNISLSYNEAVEALKYKLYQGKNEIISIDNVGTQEGELHYYSFKKEKILINNIRIGNITEVKKIVDSIFQTLLSSASIPYAYLQQVLVKLISNIAEMVIDSGLSMEEIFGPQRNLFKELSEKETIEDIKNWLLDICIYIVDAINTTNLAKANKYVEKILDYINENINHDISLNDVAEWIGLTPAYVSTIFKENIGKNYVDYLNSSRIEKAKQLLRETKLNIEEIGFRIGFNNIQTFMRIFKKYEGITPGQYRNNI